MGSELRVDVSGGTVAQLTQVGQARDLIFPGATFDLKDLQALLSARPVSFDTLFETIDDPGGIAAAVFRSRHERVAAAPLSRDDFARELADRLRRNRAVLLIGRGGLGKTHEVVALSEKLATERGFVVAAALPNAELQLDRLGSIEGSAARNHTVFILDDVHLRAEATGGGESLARRLSTFTTRLQRERPGAWFLLATARNEPAALRLLGIDRQANQWGPCAVVSLPEFSDTQLRDALVAFAAHAAVAVDTETAGALVANSDRTPRTLEANVELARRRARPLSQATWRPTQQDSWKARFDDVSAEHEDALQLFRALALLRGLELPLRRTIVEAVATTLGASAASVAADALIEASLVGVHGDRLDAFADEALRDCLGAEAVGGEPTDAELDGVAVVLREHATAEEVASLLTLAMRLALRDRHELSLAVADRALEFGAHNGVLHFSRGLALSGLQRWAEAEAAFTAAMDLGITDTVAWTQRARVRMVMGRTEAARGDLAHAFAQDAGNAMAFEILTHICFAEGDLEGVVQNADRALGAGGYSAGLCIARARALAGLGKRLDEAVADLRRPDILALDSPLASYAIALALLKQQHYDEARAEAEHALALDPAFTAAMSIPIHVHLLRGDIESARVAAEHAYAHSAPEGRTEILSPLTLIVRNLGDHDRVIALSGEILALNPASTTAHLWRAEAELALGRYADALADAEIAVQRNPDDGSARLICAHAAFSASNLRRAVTAFAEAIARGQDTPAVHYAYASALARYGDLDRARREAALLPDDEATVGWRDNIEQVLAYAAGDFVTALGAAQRVADRGEEPLANIDVALALLFAGQVDEAMAWAAKLAEVTTAAEQQLAIDELVFWRGRHPAAVSDADAARWRERLTSAPETP